MKKRILSIMLACFMIISLLPMGAFAAEIKCPGAGDHTAENCTNEVVEVVPAVCNGFGYTVYRCLGCEDLFVDDITEMKGDHVMEAIVGKEPTCAYNEETEEYELINGVVGGEICSICGWFNPEVYAVAPGTEIVAEHDYVAEEGATCLTGTTYTCTVCEHSYTTQSGEHEWVELPTIEKDPDEQNLKDGVAIYECKLCGETKEVDILHHECSKFAVAVGKAPTCTETGLKDAWMCTVCGRYTYTNEKGKEVTTKDINDLVLPMLDHVTTTSETIFLTANVKTPLSVPYKATLTFTVTGARALYLYLVGEENDTQIIRVAPSTTDSVVVEAGEYYLQSGGDISAEMVTAYEQIIVPADCITKTNGSHTFYCAVCATEVVETLKWEDAHNKKLLEHLDPTCTEYGFDVWGCTLCGMEETTPIDPTDHTPEKKWGSYVYKNKTYADCTTDGYTGDVMCAVCGEIAIKGEVIPATGHTEGIRNVAPSCVSVSMSYTWCTYCKEPLSEITYGTELDPDNHVNKSTKSSTSATCFEDGVKIWACDDCGYEGKDITPKYNHTNPYTGASYITKKVETVPATCTSEGYTVYACTYYNCKCATETDGKYKEKRDFVDKLTHEDVYNFEDLPADCTQLNEIRKVTCTEDGLYAYQCNKCKAVFLVVKTAPGHTAPADSVDYIEAPVDADCENPGFSGTYECTVCTEMVEGEKIEALGHDIVTVEHKDPTCTEEGVVGGSYCARCEASKKADVEEKILATGHAFGMTDHYLPADFTAETDPGFIYAHVECANGCGEEYIVNYHRHNWILDEEASVAPECTKEGLNVYTCTCGLVKEETVERLYHIYNGEKLSNICANNGIACDRCGKVMYKDHALGQWKYVEANCQNGSYEIAFCTKCDDFKVNPLDETLGDHIWGNAQELIVDGVGTGVYVTFCTVCGAQKEAENIVNYNALIAEGDLTIGSELAVTITMNADALEIFGFDIDVNYDNEQLNFLRAEAGETFAIFHNNNENVNNTTKDYVSVAGNANGSAKVFTEVVVTLYFEVLTEGFGEITITHNDTAAADVEKTIEATTKGADYIVYMLGDVNKDGKINIFDIQYIYNFMIGAEGYEATILGDVNGDGVIMDRDDMLALYEIIVG